mgnify:CR=1 FL=1
MSDKIRKYVLPNLPYLFVFWFFSKIGTAYRIAPGTDFGTKLMGMLDTFPKAFETYWPGLGGIDLLVGLAGAAGVYLLIQSKIRQAKKFRRDAEYGTARFGTKEDIKPFVDPKFQNNVILTGTEFLTMNTRPKIPANARNLNACVIGSSGSGKTRFWLTPQLLQAHSSYVVVDPKGGTLDQCGRFLQREKYRVRVFNSIDFSKSMHYNPLAYIKTESDVLKFVTALIANTKGDGKEGDEFWTKAETLLYCALVAYIVFEGPEEERNMNTLVEMINSMEVREDDETFKNAVDYMFDGLERRSPQHFAVRQYKKYKLASGDAYGDNAVDSESTGDGDYYFTYNNTLYMVLNTSCLSIAEHKAFLEETIQANPDVTWKVVSFHKSIYSVASHVTESDIVTLRNGLSPILSQLGIDIVLQGHDHVYARSYIMGGESGMTADVQKNADGSALTEVTNPDGVQYITMNSASGSKFYKITEEAFEYTAVQNQEKVPNYSVANVTKDAFTVTTYRSTDDSVVDTITIKKSKNGWETVDGKDYWYEDGVKQGTEGRGKEIYDPESDAWYWLDSDANGAKAVSKDVYQESDGGKWVRYDENGKMIKGWNTNEKGTYYFDPITGAMAKGDVEIDGVPCSFDETTGIGLNLAWKQENGKDYWYENGQRQGLEGRGKEIYDPESDGWYWLDSDANGAKAVSKDVYQESDGGKWVRYDANGQMIKGWNTNENGTYYFDPITGAMAHGTVEINGKTCHFDEATGILK